MKKLPLADQLTLPLEETRRAVIDIGSNSVRLVLINGPARAPLPILNEKSLCGLGRDMLDDGRLNPDAKAEALRVIQRFALLLKAHDNPPTHVIATAAVRDATDGADFIKAVERLGFTINLLSGEQEADFAAQGVLSLNPSAYGVVGDLGGGSLELSRIVDGTIERGGSLKIGPFQLMTKSNKDLRKSSSLVKKSLTSIDWLGDGSADTFYAVGGAWRTIARMHMALRKYPLSVLHQYTMSAKDVIELCELIERQSRESLQDMDGISRRRLDTLPYAAIVLRRLVQYLGAKRIVISAGGVREGVLFAHLPGKIKTLDPVIAFARTLAVRYSPNPALGPAIMPFVRSLLAPQDDRQERLQMMICLLVDIAAYAHPSHRGRQAFDMALGLPIVGLTHDERIMTGLALYRRYEGRSANPPDVAAVRLLSREQTDFAEKLGLAIRFLADFSPKVTKPLAGCALQIKGDEIVFRVPAKKQALIGELPEKRLASLGTRMGLGAVIELIE